MTSNLDFFSTLDKELAVPVDSGAVSKCRKTMERVTVDHLLPKLNSDSVKVMSCLSPVDGVGLSYLEKYLTPPLCDGFYFQGYNVNIKEHKII